MIVDKISKRKLADFAQESPKKVPKLASIEENCNFGMDVDIPGSSEPDERAEAFRKFNDRPGDSDRFWDVILPSMPFGEYYTIQTLPKIDESNTMESKPPKEKILEILDILESHVEKLRKEASRLEEERDHLLATLDSVRNTDLLSQLDPNDVDDVNQYADRIMNRCLTVEVKVLTQRDHMQEDALHQVNLLIDGLVMSLQEDPVQAKVKCISYMNACSSSYVEGIADKRFECAILGCTVDDQKRVKKRLHGLLSYLDKLKVTVFEF